MEGDLHGKLSRGPKTCLDEWRFFRRGEKKNSSHYWAVCLGCEQLAVQTGQQDIPKVAGRKESLIHHLRHCPNIPNEAKVLYQSPVIGGRRKRKLSKSKASDVDLMLAQEQYHEFETELLFAALEGRLGLEFFESAHVAKLMKMMQPGLIMPSAARVFGSVLTEADKRIFEQGVSNLAVARSVVLALDSWRNIKSSGLFPLFLISSGAARVQEQLLYNVERVASLDATSQASQEIMVYSVQSLQTMHNIVIDAVLVDECSEMKFALDTVCESMPWIMRVPVPSYFFDQLFRGLLVAENSPMPSAKMFVKSLLMLVNWIGSRSEVLNAIKGTQLEQYGRHIVLWNQDPYLWKSLGDSVEALLQSHGALQTVFSQSRHSVLDGLFGEDLSQAQGMLHIVDSNDFWRDLVMVAEVLRPISACLDICRKSISLLSSTFICLVYLHGAFSYRKDEVGTFVTNKLQNLWKRMDQKIFILCYVLHPGYRIRSLNPSVLSWNQLTSMVEETFVRLFRRQSATVVSDFMKYSTGTAPCTHDCMDQFLDQPILFWEFLSQTMPDLSRLALKLLQLAPPSSSIEDVFASMESYSFGKANRMSHDRSVMMARARASSVQASKLPLEESFKRDEGDVELDVFAEFSVNFDAFFEDSGNAGEVTSASALSLDADAVGSMQSIIDSQLALDQVIVSNDEIGEVFLDLANRTASGTA
jgi:hypothetical protein